MFDISTRQIEEKVEFDHHYGVITNITKAKYRTTSKAKNVRFGSNLQEI